MKSSSHALVALATALGLWSIAPACGDTDGRRVVVAFRYASVADDAMPLGEFDTETGYHVVLTEARVAIGPTYVLAPSSHATHARRTRKVLAAMLTPSVARAHGGVDPLSGRAVLAQALEQHALDLLDAAPTTPLTTIATAGPSRSVTLALDPPTPVNAPALRDLHVHLEGVATRDGLVFPFRGGITLPDAGTTRRVQNIALDAQLDEGGLITIAVHPSHLLAGADFDRLGTPDESGTSAIVPGDQVAGALSIGLRSPSTFTASYTPGTP